MSLNGLLSIASTLAIVAAGVFAGMQVRQLNKQPALPLSRRNLTGLRRSLIVSRLKPHTHIELTARPKMVALSVEKRDVVAIVE